MKSFMQFFIPIFAVLVIGGVMMFIASPRSETKRLYIACNDSSFGRGNRFNVVATDVINFMENDDECSLTVEVGNIGERYIRLITPYMYHVDVRGERERTPRAEVFITVDEEVVLYSLDGETKFTFRFR